MRNIIFAALMILCLPYVARAEETRIRNFDDRVGQSQERRLERQKQNTQTLWRNQLRNSKLERQVDRQQTSEEQLKRRNDQVWDNRKRSNQNQYKRRNDNYKRDFQRQAERFRRLND